MTQKEGEPTPSKRPTIFEKHPKIIQGVLGAFAVGGFAFTVYESALVFLNQSAILNPIIPGIFTGASGLLVARLERKQQGKNTPK